MSFLDHVQLAFSCPMAWERLVGGDRSRYCGACEKHVYDLSAMSRDEAEGFLEENEGLPICVRVEVDADQRAVHRSSTGVVLAVAATAAVAGAMAAEKTSAVSLIWGEEPVEEAADETVHADEFDIPPHERHVGGRVLLGGI
jgi:hypothetical protein